MIVDLPGFLVAATVVIAVPGPATLYVAGIAHRSRRRAALAVLGLVAGDVALIAAAGAGAAAVLARRPALATGIAFAGGVYLVYLGVAMMRPRRPAAGEASPPPTTVVGRELAAAFALTLTNPKPIVFFGTFFPAFLAPGPPTPLGFAALGALFEAINLAYFTAVVALVGAVRATSLVTPRTAAHLRALAGAVLVGCGVLVMTR